MKQPVVNFYYGKTVPESAVSIAHVKSKPVTPADYIDKLNTMPASGQIGPGGTGAKAWPVEANVFPPAGLRNVLAVNDDPDDTGASYEYTVQNQFIEVTDKWDSNGTYFYYHPIPSGAGRIQIFKNKTEVTEGFLIEGNRIYHTFDGSLMWVQFYVGTEIMREVLTYLEVMKKSPRRNSEEAPFVAPDTYSWTHGVIDLPSNEEHRFRFLEDNRYRILDPYTTLPNDPWYVRIRFNMAPMPAEWSRMLFSPFRPYRVATWVPGKKIDEGVIEFERKKMFWNGERYPDVLIFDKDYNLKFALDGNPTESLEKQGYIYPWSRSHFLQVDPMTSRVRVDVEVEETDIIYGFYFYEEQDLVYTSIDINPFTNPKIQNKTVEFVHRISSSFPTRHIWHRVYDYKGNLVPELSQEPSNGTAYVIGRLVVGGSVSLSEFEVKDTRVRGGGLAEEHHNDAKARDFWDIGFWDGKPYPVKGGMVIYLPSSILTTFTQDYIRAVVSSLVPMGTVPVIRYYSADGEEQ